ncbi:MAG TPA: sigma-70 family RNA polymerase sigma factor [Pirellulaceae bacterium]|nr:sigma-70 family RNA polymerase sigma factor [Pirellulaceae bacterium]HMO93337.1 sigma-70 family RNA polymerase sigma factor [Pirellulaceae bacterium]HMP70108.1 sigma-70 family RNA polymerase sigma factor [Pirellulaceae bacterium]
MSQESSNSSNQNDDLSGLCFQELVRRAQSGHDGALGRLVEECRDYLLLIANEDLDQKLLGKLGASDIVQDTMLIAHEKFAQFRGQTPAELKGWLRQILLHDLNRTRRQFVDAHRRDVHRERAIDDSQFQPLPLADNANTPRTDAMIQEEARLLNEAMLNLPENYRRAVQLREWEDLSYGEIGRRLGVSEEAARKLCRRGLDKLENLLRPYIGNQDSIFAEDTEMDDERP